MRQTKETHFDYSNYHTDYNADYIRELDNHKLTTLIYLKADITCKYTGAIDLYIMVSNCSPSGKDKSNALSSLFLIMTADSGLSISDASPSE